MPNPGLGLGYNGRGNAPRHGCKVWVELNDAVGECRFLELFLNLGKMPVLGQAIGPHAFVPFAVDKIFGDLPARAADATVAVDDNPLRFDESRLEQWDKGNLHTGRVATGAGDERGLLPFSSASSGIT